jgi:hypothetical protein
MAVGHSKAVVAAARESLSYAKYRESPSILGKGG